jgi:hypothetical protein
MIRSVENIFFIINQSFPFSIFRKAIFARKNYFYSPKKVAIKEKTWYNVIE